MSNDDAFAELFAKSTLYRQAYESFAIHAAHELRLFDQIATQARSAGDIAVRGGLSIRGAELLMNCLIAADVVERQAGGYALCERFRQLFTMQAAEAAALIESSRAQARLWLDAAERLRERHATGDIRELFNRDEAWTAQYQTRVESNNTPFAREIARQLEPRIARARSMLDLGGGHGYFARAFAQRNPELRLTIYDLPAAIAYCRTRAGDYSLPAQVELIEGDARDLALEARFDLVVISDLLHYLTDAEKVSVVARALRALVPDGLLVISKFRLDETGSAPRFSVFFALYKHLETPNGGYLETDAHCAELVREAGGREVQIVPVHEQKSVILAHRA